MTAVVIVVLRGHRHRGEGMADIHHGYVAGRYRDGVLSDTWTDVRRCAEGTFIAYVARCECDWRGENHPADSDGYHACQRELIRSHLSSLAGDAIPYQPAPPGRRSYVQ